VKRKPHYLHPLPSPPLRFFPFAQSRNIVLMTPKNVYSSPKSVSELQVPLEQFDEILLSETPLPDSSPSLVRENPSYVDEHWVCPPSFKSRTRNPIRAIVDPIVQNIKSGEERGDGKDHISLAVSGGHTKRISCTVVVRQDQKFAHFPLFANRFLV
jgi:hypothetical protein